MSALQSCPVLGDGRLQFVYGAFTRAGKRCVPGHHGGAAGDRTGETLAGGTDSFEDERVSAPGAADDDFAGSVSATAADMTPATAVPRIGPADPVTEAATFATSIAVESGWRRPSSPNTSMNAIARPPLVPAQ